MRASQATVWRDVTVGNAETGGEPDERKLLEDLARGDRAAAEALVEATYPFIYASCHRLTGGDADRAADLTQETYRRAWIALGSFEGRCRFTTWLYRIAYNAWLNQLRGSRRVVALVEQHHDPWDPAPDPHAKLAGDADAGGIREAVLALPEELRFPVTAHFWGELSVREIAVQEGITTVAVRKRLKRAFALLAGALEEQS